MIQEPPAASLKLDTVILASQSAARRAMLSAAGVAFEAVSPHVDEEGIRDALRARGAPPRDIADALAETKAVKLSRRFPNALVLGADQILVVEDGRIVERGKHAELLGRGGLYADLYRTQYFEDSTTVTGPW
mgnify:CR=1 FL=1